MNCLRKDLTVQSGIVECNRCDLCERSDGARVSLACGHSACAVCVAAPECQACAQLMDPLSNRRRVADPKIERASYEVSPLQDTLQLDVYQKERISERLRVEKELFPECIQAPAKYYNKRKSLNESNRNKENRHTTVLPGEETSLSQQLIMNKSRNFVQEWLNKQPNSSFGPQPRSPFSDLKVNTQHKLPAHSTPIKGKQKENATKLPTRASNRKRPRLKQAPSTSSLTSLENYLKLPEKGNNKKAWTAKRMKQEFDDTSKPSDHKLPCDESGIVIDDDCYIIQDTQDQSVDKDRLALLEVEKANLKKHSESVIDIGDTEENHCAIKDASASIKHDEEEMHHVPFYKKSHLFESCAQCITTVKDTLIEDKLKSYDNTGRSNDVSITVENKSFITTITVVDCNPVDSGRKQTTEVQTDITEPFLGFEQLSQKESASLIAKIKGFIETDDVSASREKKVLGIDSQQIPCPDVNLEKWDGDNKADGKVVREDMLIIGHSSEYDFGVLTALDGAGFQNKRRRGPRGATPDSNNSSDKENCDPNRKKKQDGKKKKKYK